MSTSLSRRAFLKGGVVGAPAATTRLLPVLVSTDEPADEEIKLVGKAVKALGSGSPLMDR